MRATITMHSAFPPLPSLSYGSAGQVPGEVHRIREEPALHTVLAIRLENLAPPPKTSLDMIQDLSDGNISAFHRTWKDLRPFLRRLRKFPSWAVQA